MLAQEICLELEPYVAKAISGSHCNGFRFFNLGGK